MSHSCDWVALVGNPSYRYVWLVGQAGWGYPFRTRGTPLVAAIAPNDDLVAVGTAGGHVHLLSQRAELVADKDLGFAVVAALKFASSGNRVIITEGSSVGVLARSAESVWTAADGSLSVTNDLARSISWSQPNHFSSLGGISLRSADGKVCSAMPMHNAEAGISADGSTIVALGVPDRSDESYVDSSASRLFFLNSSGEIQRSMPAPNRQLVDLSADGRIVILAGYDGRVHCYSAGGEELWSFSAGERGVRVVGRHDLAYLLAFDTSHLRVFKVP